MIEGTASRGTAAQVITTDACDSRFAIRLVTIICTSDDSEITAAEPQASRKGRGHSSNLPLRPFERLQHFLVAIRSLDSDGWDDAKSPFFKARVLRALLRVLSDMMADQRLQDLTATRIRDQLARIDADTLSDEEVRKAQGAAGVRDLYLQIRGQVFDA